MPNESGLHRPSSETGLGVILKILGLIAVPLGLILLVHLWIG